MAEAKPPSSEKNPPSTSSDRVRDMMREGFTLMLGAASWAYEKGDQLVGTWMQQGEVSREQGKRKFEELAERTRKGSEELGRKVTERVREATASMPVATREQVQNLERRVEELTRQIELMRRTAPPESESRPSSSSGGASGSRK